MANFNLPVNRNEVSDRINSDIKAQLPNSNPYLRNSYIGSLTFGIAGRIYDVYQKILIMIQQFFINTASGIYLSRWGAIYNITRNPATSASGYITLSGTAGVLISSGTALQSLTGIQYLTNSNINISTQLVSITSMSRSGDAVTVDFASNHNLASGVIIDSISGATPSDFNSTNILITVTSPTQLQFTLSGTSGVASGTILAQWTTASVLVTATSSGENTNASSGSSLTLTTPNAGVNNIAYVQFTELSNGSDQEDDNSYRQRILDRIQQPFSFFNVNALKNQAKLVSGVTRVWVFSPDSTSALISISSITRNGQIATATSINHGLADGAYVTVAGAIQSDYNVLQKRIIVIDVNTFAYVVSGSPTTPATGTITAAYSFVEEGQVRIYFVRDDDSSIIPSSAEVNTVKDKILEIKPAHVIDSDVVVSGPIPVSIDFTFSSLSPNTSAMQTAITQALTDFFRTANNVGANVKLSDLNGLIAQVIDSGGFSPVYNLSSPSGDVTIGLGEIGILGNIIYP